MGDTSNRVRFHPLVCAIVVGCAATLFGCNATTRSQAKPTVVEEQPPKAAVEEQSPQTVETAEKPPEAVAEVPKAPSAPLPKPKPKPVPPLPADAPAFWKHVPELMSFHRFENGLRWRLSSSGIELEDAVIEGHKVDHRVIQDVWDRYGAIMERWSTHYGVPFEIVMTTVCVESRGEPRARNNRNYGIMQLLVRTARYVLNDQSLTEESLYDPDTAVKAGTAYMALQQRSTRYDPPKVAAAYNAGSLRSASNPWGMRQYGRHLDKTVLWFNAILAFVASQEEVPQVSFADYFRRNP